MFFGLGLGVGVYRVDWQIRNGVRTMKTQPVAETKHDLGLPYRIGNEKGYNASTIYSGDGMDEQAVAEVYGMPIHRSLKQIEGDKLCAIGFERMRFIVRACNSHDQIVEALISAITEFELAEDKFADNENYHPFMDQLRAALAAAQS